MHRFLLKSNRNTDTTYLHPYDKITTLEATIPCKQNVVSLWLPYLANKMLFRCCCCCFCFCFCRGCCCMCLPFYLESCFFFFKNIVSILKARFYIFNMRLKRCSYYEKKCHARFLMSVIISERWHLLKMSYMKSQVSNNMDFTVMNFYDMIYSTAILYRKLYSFEQQYFECHFRLYVTCSADLMSLSFHLEGIKWHTDVHLKDCI